MDKITITIDRTPYEVAPGGSVLEAIQNTGRTIPTLCSLKQVNCVGACRMCVVEINGRIMAACTTKLAAGMEIRTVTPKLERLRKATLQLICSDHRQDCSACARFPYCELHTLCRRYGIDDRVNMFSRKPEIHDCGPHLIRDNSKCILCRRCISTCRGVQGIGAIGLVGRGPGARVMNTSTLHPELSPCVSCGQCIAACPTGALMEKSEARPVGVALAHKKKHMIAVVTPEAAAQLGGYFGTEPETADGKTAAALRRLGFRGVYTSMDQAGAIVSRQAEKLEYSLKHKGPMLLAGLCPSAVKLIRRQYPELSQNLNDTDNILYGCAENCRTDYALRRHVGPEQIHVVTVSSCTADKYLRTQPAYAEITDAALTTHELYAMFERACVSSFSAGEVWKALPGEAYDRIRSAPAGLQCGGNSTLMQVIEALGGIPSVSRREENETGSLTEVSFTWQEGQYTALQVSGLNRLQALLADSERLSHCVYIEAMACPGGCKNGAGKARRRREASDINS